LQRYVYAGDEPVGRSDPTGLRWDFEVDAAGEEKRASSDAASTYAAPEPVPVPTADSNFACVGYCEFPKYPTAPPNLGHQVVEQASLALGDWVGFPITFLPQRMRPCCAPGDLLGVAANAIYRSIQPSVAEAPGPPSRHIEQHPYLGPTTTPTPIPQRLGPLPQRCYVYTSYTSCTTLGYSGR
jgi:hypothetical protein